MRKMMLALVAMFAMAGLVVAAEVMVVKFDKDKKEITVKEGDAEKTYKITDKDQVHHRPTPRARTPRSPTSPRSRSAPARVRPRSS